MLYARASYLLAGLVGVQASSIPFRARQTSGNTIVFEGRISQTTVISDFDSTNSPFQPDFTKGENLKFSDLLLIPNVAPSLFDDKVNAQPLEVTISDASIFRPGTAEPQSAVRRAELMPASSNGLTVGVKTLHFSLQPDATRPLNVSHEYLLVFLETADFSANQFRIKTGTLLGSNGASRNNLLVLGNSKAGNEVLFSTPFVDGAFTNLALKLDFDKNTIQVFHSTGNEALVQRTGPLANDLSGNGELHFGINKNPTDPGADVLRSGFQESGIDEGLIFGGIFVEDSANGSVLLS